MSGPDRSDADDQPAPPAQAGVLGNLPKTRPQVRSPRRKVRSETSASAPAETESGTEKKVSAPRAEEPARPKPDASPGRAPEQDPERPPDSGPPDLEAIARGGLHAAAGAATLGLRIAGRAAAVIRDSVERR
jgi:hypothetical protein